MKPWSQVISEIVEAGMSLRAASREISIPKSTLHELASGKVEEPRFSVGQKLLDIHKRLVPSESTTCGCHGPR